MTDPTFQPSTMDITAGYAAIQEVDGDPGPADDITYVCTLFMPDGIYRDVPGMIPNVARYPDPVLVTPHHVGTVFPAYRMNGHVQLSMPRELPQFTPCPSGGQLMGGGGNLLAAVSQMDATQRAMLRKLIMEGA